MDDGQGVVAGVRRQIGGRTGRRRGARAAHRARVAESLGTVLFRAVEEAQIELTSGVEGHFRRERVRRWRATETRREGLVDFENIHRTTPATFASFPTPQTEKPENPVRTIFLFPPPALFTTSALRRTFAGLFLFFSIAKNGGKVQPIIFGFAITGRISSGSRRNFPDPAGAARAVVGPSLLGKTHTKREMPQFSNFLQL